MRIIIDAFGGDNAPDEIIKGCRLAADELHVQIVLTGDEKKIRAAAEKLNVNVSDVEIIDCSCRNPRAFSCWQTAAQTTNAAPKCWSSSA